MPTVLLISPEPMEAYQGGAGVYLSNMIREFNELGKYHFVILNYGDNPGIVNSGENFTTCHVPAPPLDEYLTPPGASSYSRQLSEFLRDSGIQPDILHLIDIIPFGEFLKSSLGVPCVYDLHLSVCHEPDTFLWYTHGQFGATEPSREDLKAAASSMEQRCMDIADIVVVHSQYYGRLCEQWKKKTIVIYNGIDTGQWKKKSNFVFPGERSVKLVYLGRFDFMKGVDQLLEAQMPMEIDLVLYGTSAGRYAKSVLEHSENIDEVHYGGAIYGQEKVDMLFAADALICPSRHEPFGIVALEALASRSVLLTSFAGGLAENIPRSVGVDCGSDKYTITKALEKLGSMSEEERQARLSDGCRVLDYFSWSKAARRLFYVYDNLIQ